MRIDTGIPFPSRATRLSDAFRTFVQLKNKDVADRNKGEEERRHSTLRGAE